MTADQLIAECKRLAARPGTGTESVWHQGRPPGAKPTLAEVRPLLRAYYRLPGNGVGGELHCVLDDGNYERRHIRSCIASAERVETRWLGHVLLLLSNSQRRRMGYCGYAG